MSRSPLLERGSIQILSGALIKLLAFSHVLPASLERNTAAFPSLTPPTTSERESAGSIASATISPTEFESEIIVSSAWSEFIRTPRTADGLGQTNFQDSPSSVLRHSACVPA